MDTIDRFSKLVKYGGNLWQYVETNDSWWKLVTDGGNWCQMCKLVTDGGN